mmetsp:Transcript_36982/g.6592  ORF Transcript_36982/g.6592 Transcript_36982/m.6592 type:complete len:116 (+) Transcript_36982:175-522(+)
MGILERYKKLNGEGSALSVVDRSEPYSKFGGRQEFHELMNHANGLGMKIIIDSISRVSSRHYSRKYKDNKIYIKDSNGLPVTCYGTDGRSLKYDDSLMLNYRKVETWNLLVEEIL